MTNLHEASDVATTLRESDLSIRRFRGSTYDEALAAAQAELGERLRVIGADRIRRGGLGGFFATDLGVEVAVVADIGGDGDASAPARRAERVPAPASVSDAEWDELMRRVEADDLRARGPVARRVGVDRLLEDAERADRELCTWTADDVLDVPDFLQNATSRSAGRAIDPDAFGIDVSPATDDRLDERLAVDAVERRIVDGGNGGRRLLEDVLAAALADEAPLAPAAAPHEVESMEGNDEGVRAHDDRRVIQVEPPMDVPMDVRMDRATDARMDRATDVRMDRATDDLFDGIVDYEPFDAVAAVAAVPSPAPLAAPAPVVRADPPALPAPIDPLRRPTELATIAAGRLATRLAELPRAGGVQAECYRVSVAVTTPDGTRIEMSTEVDGAGD